MARPPEDTFPLRDVRRLPEHSMVLNGRFKFWVPDFLAQNNGLWTKILVGCLVVLIPAMIIQGLNTYIQLQVLTSRVTGLEDTVKRGIQENYKKSDAERDLNWRDNLFRRLETRVEQMERHHNDG